MPRNRRVLTLAVLALCVSLSLLAVGGLAPVGEVAAQDEETNETDAPHANPDETYEDGDSERVASWLQDRLSGSLGESSVQLSEGQYDQAREAVGDDYNSHLSQYVEITGNTDEAEEFEATRDSQTELINNVEEYNETYEEYEAAREAGNDERARELARELDSLSDSVDEQSRELQERQETIEAETGANTSESRAAVEETRSDIEATQQEVRETEFVPTELMVTTGSETASFNDPMTIEGTITTTDGAPVANENITLEIGEQTVQTTTDTTGSFAVDYRPTIESLNMTELEIQYTPATQSEYGGNDTTVPVNIEQSEADIEITETNESTAFGEQFSTTGVVEANGISVEGVPVAVFADGERLGEVETNEQGAFELTTELPANVSAGEIEVRALAALSNQALAGADTTTRTDVAETPGATNVTAEHSDNSIYIQGSLATEDGAPIGGEPITLEFGGESVTVETNEDGVYETLVSVPDGVGAFVTIDAIYAEDGSNIGDASASTEVQVGEETFLTRLSQILGIGWLDTSVPSFGTNHLLTLAGLLLLGLTGAYFLLENRSRSTDPAIDSTNPDTETGGSSTQDSTALRVSLLESARELARAGDPNQAVERAYVAVRQDESDQARADTHWEFYRNRRESGFASEQISALRALTQRFEQAAFSPFGVSSDDAKDAIEEAETVMDDS